jgi:RNA polymerase sigma factor (sigma-70 family)
VNSLTTYLNQAAAHPLLTAEQEVALGRLIAAGRAPGADDAAVQAGREAREAFVNANLRLVVMVAREFSRTTTVPLADLVQDGNLGLLVAVDGFDPELGFRFSTYATHWIRQRIQRALPLLDGVIRLPEEVHRARRRHVAATARHGKMSEEALAEATRTSASLMRRAISAPEALLVLDSPAGDGGRATIGDLQPDDGATPDLEALRRLDLEVLELLLDRLPEDLRDVLVGHYGLGGAAPLSTHALARRQRCSPSTVRRRHDDAVALLRDRMALAA